MSRGHGGRRVLACVDIGAPAAAAAAAAAAALRERRKAIRALLTNRAYRDGGRHHTKQAHRVSTAGGA